MKHLYWLIPVIIGTGCLLTLMSWEAPLPHEVVAKAEFPTAVNPARSHLATAGDTGVITRNHWTAHTPLGEDRRRLTGEPASLGKSTTTHHVPTVFTAFDQWLSLQLTSLEMERPARLAEGRALLAARQALWPDFARSNPEAALFLTPSPLARGILPPEMAAQLEQIVAGEGFYGVKAVCNHEPAGEHGEGCRIEHEVFINGRSYQAAIYGTRTERRTEESASIYGVVLGGLIALHEDDVVVLPANEVDASAAADHVAVIHFGKTTVLPEARLADHIQTLMNP